MQPDKMAEPIPAGCDAAMADDVRMMREAADQQTVCGWIIENPCYHVVLLGRRVLPGWLMPYHLTGLLMQTESAQLRFDRAALPGALSDKSMPCTVPPAEFILNFKGYLAP